MAIVKKGLIKIWVRILAFFLSIFSLKSCAIGSLFGNVQPSYGVIAEYGTPYADYVVIGKVQDEIDDHEIPGISVNFKEGYDLINGNTDNSGDYQAESHNYYFKNIMTIQFKDTDAAVNGSYADRDVTADYSAAEFIGGNSNWYKGKAEIRLDIKLQRK